MAPHPCRDVEDQLSAFFDGELELAQQRQVAEHLAQCPACASQLADFRRIRDQFQASILAETPNQWPSIATEISLRQPAVERGGWRYRTFFVGALAASLVLAIGYWANISSHNAGPELAHEMAPDVTHDLAHAQHSHGAHAMNSEHMNSEHMNSEHMNSEHMKEFQQVMGDYVVKLATNPDQAEDFLLAKYDTQRVSPDSAESLVGYRPLVLRGFPTGYEISSTSVVKMPCCTCFKAVCRRSDGSTLVLFEHDTSEAKWFGDRKSNMATCGDKDCCLVELDSSIAATWKEGSRSITAVGARDENEVALLVQALKQS